MKNKGIKNLLIDFGGVLIDLHRQRCIDNFKELGLENIDEYLNVYHQRGLFLEQEKGLITPPQFRDGIRDLLGRMVSDEKIDAVWNSFLGEIPRYKLDLLLKLRENYVVYLLSNTNEIHWKWACQNTFPYRTFRVDDYFEKKYISYQMKMAKPDRDIFEAVLDDAGILPEETFFIDDSQANCLTAQSLGISTYTPAEGEDWSHLFK